MLRLALRHPGAVVALLAIALYLPSIGGGFLYDDYRVVLDNRALRDLGRPLTILLSDPTRPLLAAGFALNWAISGDRAWSYHLVNVALHAANAWLVAALLGWLARGHGAERARLHALLGGALFALTPMAVETVAYVASRSTAQCALFSLLALLRCRAALETPGGRAPLAAVGWFVLALLSKEEAASVPLYLLALDAAGGHGPLRSRWRLHLPFFALPGLGLLARRAVTGEWLPPGAVPPGDYLLTQLAAFPLYLGRAFLPLDPALYREHPLASWPPQAEILVLAAVGAALLAAAVFAWRRASGFAFAVAWMAAGLVPSSTLVALNEMVVDHRAYLGGAGAHHALAVGLRALPPAAGGAAVIAFGLRAAHFEWTLRDPVRAWQDAARRLPASPMVQLNLARALESQGDHGAAIAALERGLELAPADHRLWTNLGAVNLAAGRMAQAEQALRQALALRPHDTRLRNNLALVLAALGRTAEARNELEQVLREEPAPTAQPRIDLARLLSAPDAPPQEDVARARALIEEARRLAREEADSPELEAVAERLRRLP
jgi:tetratricopeptide (TPR) repeat protein